MGRIAAATRTSWGLGMTDEDWRRVKLAGRIAGGVTGTLAGLAGLSVALLMRQAADARRVIPMAEAPPPRCDGLYGPKFPGKPLTMVILGDSTGAGYGVHRPRETPGALLATGVSRRLHRPVRLHRVAVVGSMSAGLPYQVDAALEFEPDVAIILIGGNDVTHVTGRSAAVRHLGEAVRRLRAVGCKVVVGTCPDIGTIQPIKPPLRWLARTWSRQLAAEQTVAVIEAGGSTVSLGDLLGPAFEADPVRMFGSDHFHPSVEGYARAAAVMMPTLMAVLGEDDRTPAPRGAGVRSLEAAALEAVRSPGTEVRGTRLGGAAELLAQLRRHPWFGEQRRWLFWQARSDDSAVPVSPVPVAGPASRAVSGPLSPAPGSVQSVGDGPSRATVTKGRPVSGPVGWTEEGDQAGIGREAT